MLIFVRDDQYFGLQLNTIQMTNCSKINHVTFHCLKVNQLKQAETLASFNNKKAEFEKLRSDVQIKLKFLDENRVKVTSLYHVSSYTRESDIQQRKRTR